MNSPEMLFEGVNESLKRYAHIGSFYLLSMLEYF